MADFAANDQRGHSKGRELRARTAAADGDGRRPDPISQMSSDVDIDRPVHLVWEILADLDAMPALHGHLLSAHWLDGAREAALGARFAGTYASPAFGTWQAISTIVEFELDQAIAWTIESAAVPAMVCRFELAAPDDSHAHVRQTYTIDRRPGAAPPVARATAD